MGEVSGINDLNLLFLTRNGKGYVGAPNTFYEFEQAVAEKANCVFAGEDWPLYRAQESVDLSVKRVMPDADWVFMNKNILEKVEESTNRRYGVGVFLSDIHGKASHRLGSPSAFRDYLNKLNYDAFFLKYMEAYGFRESPSIFKDTLNGMVFHLPWSVDDRKFIPREKKHDVTFIGAISSTYPLRNSVWDGLESVADKYRVVKEAKPYGKTFERRVSEMNHKYVGENYCKLLGESKIMTFGCSRYRYPVQKYFESPSCGCLVVADKPSSAEQLGFIDEKTYVEANLNNWKEKLLYYLENEYELKRIARAGLKNVLMNHSHERRAEQFLEMLQ